MSGLMNGDGRRERWSVSTPRVRARAHMIVMKLITHCGGIIA